jgi:hypothetical protein
MPKSYTFCKFENFPTLKVGDNINTGGQSDAFEDIPVRGAHSKVTFLGGSDNELFTKYKVVHETKKKYRHRVGADIRNSLIAIDEFHLFRHRDDYFMVDTNRREIRELYDRLLQSDFGFLILLKFRSVNLRGLHENITRQGASTEVGGGYFHQLKVDRVSSVNIFGHDVGQSPYWEEFEVKGELGGLLLNFEFYNEPTTAMITASGSIVIYSSYEENLALELVDNLNRLVEPHSEEILASARRRKR